MCYDPCSLVVVAHTHVIVTCTLVYIRVVTTIKCLTVASCSRHNNGDQDAEWMEEKMFGRRPPGPRPRKKNGRAVTEKKTQLGEDGSERWMCGWSLS